MMRRIVSCLLAVLLKRGQGGSSWPKRNPTNVRILVATAQRQRAANIVEHIAQARLTARQSPATAGMGSALLAKRRVQQVRSSEGPCDCVDFCGDSLWKSVAVRQYPYAAKQSRTFRAVMAYLNQSHRVLRMASLILITRLKVRFLPRSPALQYGR